MRKSITRPGKIIIIVAALATILALQISGITAAWFSNKNEMDPRVNNGLVIQQYFDSGDGSEDNPFVITRPVHYFHMAELYQRDSTFYENEYYFQIGKQLKIDEGDSSYYVYNYDDTGSPILEAGNEYSTSLNMAYYCNELALLPIGSSEVPFNGKLDGKGLQVSNLHIKSVETIQENVDGVLVNKTFESSDIGIFGYIEGDIVGGAYKGGYVHDVKFENVTIDLEGLNFAKHPASSASYIDSDKNLTFVGYIAGHLPVLSYSNESGSVNVTGILENVYVNECSVIGASETSYFGTPINNYGIIGHITSLSGDEVPSLKTLIEESKVNAPSEVHHYGEGELPVDALGWGASLDMAATYDRLVTIYNLCTDDNYYYDEEKHQAFYLYLGISDTNIDGSNDPSRPKVYGGSYYYAVNDLSANPTIYLSGAYGEITDIIKYTDGFFINRGSNYLDVTDSLVVSNALSKDEAMNFEFETIGTEQENKKYLYFDIGEDKYYVNSDGGGNLVISATPTTIWHSGSEALHLDGNSALTTIINGEEYFLTYYQEKWQLIKVGTFYNVKYQEKYLTISDEEVISFSEEYPTDFEIASNSYDSATGINSFKLFKNIGGANMYLAVDSAKKLTLTDDINSACLLRVESNREIFITDSNNGVVGKYDKRYYLVYDESNSWIFTYNEVYYLIADGENFLALNNTSLIGSDLINADRWYIDSDNNLYTLIGEDKYYLTCDYSDSDNVLVWLTQSTTGLPNWNFEDSLNTICRYTNISVLKKGTQHYLSYYDGVWQLFGTGTFYEIKDGNYGLVISESSDNEGEYEITGALNEMTRLSFDPLGHLFFYIGGARRYITIPATYDAANRLILTDNIDNACEWTLVNDPDPTKIDHFVNAFTVKGNENEYEYYMTYDAVLGYWKAIRLGDSFSFYDKDNSTDEIKYLGYEDGSIIAVDSELDAVRFIQEDGNKYYFFDESLNRKYLDVANDHLVLSSAGCSWVYNEGDDGNFNTSKNGLYYYLVCEDGVWDVSIVGSYITIFDDTSDVFLKIDAEGQIGTSAVENEYTRIIVESGDNENERKYSVFVDGTKYYLSVPDDGIEVCLTSVAEDATSWLLGEIEDQPNKYYALYIYRNNYTYKVVYDSSSSKWIISKFGDLYSLRDGTHYMKVNNDLTLTSVQGIDASNFSFDTITATSGKLSIQIGTNIYYLSRTNTNTLTFVESSSDASIWNTTSTFETFYTSVNYTDDTLNYYLCYDNGWKLKLIDDFFYFDLLDGEDHQYLLGDALEDSISISDDEYSKFLLSENNHLYVVINDVRYFLNKGTGVDLHFDTTPVTKWDINNVNPYTATTKYIYKISDVTKYTINYVLTIVDEEWLLETTDPYFTISNEYSEFVYTASGSSPYKTTNKWFKESAGIIIDENGHTVNSYYLYTISRVNSTRMYLYNSIEDDDLSFLTYDQFMALSNSNRTRFVVTEDSYHNCIGIYTIKNGLTYYIMCEDNGDDTYTWKLDYVGKSFDIKYKTEDEDGNDAIFYLEYYIGLDDLYLIGTTNKPNTMWFYDKINNYIFTIINGLKYYINYSIDDYMCFISDEEDSQWFLNEANGEYEGNIYTIVEDYWDSINYYLAYDVWDGWYLSEQYYYRIISDMDGNYMVYDPTIDVEYDSEYDEIILSNLYSTTNINEATKFRYDLDYGYLYIIDEDDNCLYLTTYIDTSGIKMLFLSEEFSKEESGYSIPAIPYEFIGSKDDDVVPEGYFMLYDYEHEYYVAFDSDNDFWYLDFPSTTNSIFDSDANVYLDVVTSGSRLALIGNSTDNTGWSLDERNSLYTIKNGTFYYLGIDESTLTLKLLVGNSNAAFTINGGSQSAENIIITSISSRLKYKTKYLNGSWIIYRLKDVLIADYDEVDTTYLNVVFTLVGSDYVPTLTSGTDSSTATHWYFESDNNSVDDIPDSMSKFRPTSGSFESETISRYYCLDPGNGIWYLSGEKSSVPNAYASVTVDKNKENQLDFVYARWGTATKIGNLSSLIIKYNSFLATAPSKDRFAVLRHMSQGGASQIWCYSTAAAGSSTLEYGTILTIQDTIASNVFVTTGSASYPFVAQDYVEFENDLYVDTIIHEMPEIDYEDIHIVFDRNLYHDEITIPGDVEIFKNTNNFPMIISLYDKEPPDHILVRIYYDTTAPTDVSIDKIVIDKPDSINVEEYREEFEGSILIDIVIDADDVTIVRIINEKTIEHAIDITTYVPLITKLFDYAGDGAIANQYSPSTLNTGYIISGNDTNASNLYSDVQVSKNTYDDVTGTISKSLNNSISEFDIDADSSMEVLTINPVDGNYYRITDLKHNTSHPNIYGPWEEQYPAKTVLQLGLNGYENPEINIDLARDKFAKILTNTPDSIYGLRFASTTSVVSITDIVTLKNISILDTKYDYYQMPNNSIDFKVVETGTINIFAGTYYQGNNSLFSLHHVIRDDDDINKIKAIYEIETIYKVKNDDTAPYIYKYKGYELATTYQLSELDIIFETGWLTDPLLEDNAVYYYEIPVNSGEYALGSVAGKEGAYLLYLDVANKGASEGGQIDSPDAPITPQESTTPAPVTSTKPIFNNVDYRSASQEIEIDDGTNHTFKFYIGYDVPSGATEDKFNLEINYQEATERADYDDISEWCTGVYQIYIKNLTGHSFDMDVLIVNPNPSDDVQFGYAFEILLWNGERYITIQNNEVAYTSGYRGPLRRWSDTYTVFGASISAKYHH